MTSTAPVNLLLYIIIYIVNINVDNILEISLIINLHV